MKIVSCPKGGRIPEGYCKKSCLNYPHVSKRKNGIKFKVHGKSPNGTISVKCVK